MNLTEMNTRASPRKSKSFVSHPTPGEKRVDRMESIKERHGTGANHSPPLPSPQQTR